MTKKGQKAKAARIVQQVFNILQNLQPHKKVNGPVILQEALRNVKPAFVYKQQHKRAAAKLYSKCQQQLGQAIDTI